MRAGDQIPSFSAPASTGQTLSSDRWLEKTPLALFFVSNLENADAVAELSAVSDRLASFGALRVQALGVAKATAKAARSAAESYAWKMPVLADASGAIQRSFEVSADQPLVMIVDTHGIVQHVDHGAPGGERADVVLTLLGDMKADGRLAPAGRS